MEQFPDGPVATHRVDGAPGNDLVADDIFGYFGAINLEVIKNHELCFTICYKKEIDYTQTGGDQNENRSLVLISKDHKLYDTWKDGINFLLGNSMDDPDAQSTRFKKDLEFLSITFLITSPV